MDIIDISGYEYNWLPHIITSTLIIVALCVALFLTIMGRNAWGWKGEDLTIVWLLTPLFSLMVGAIGYLYYADERTNLPELQEYKVQLLDEVGYDHAKFLSQTGEDSDEFTASRDGDYFYGKLIEIEDSKFQVVELAN